MASNLKVGNVHGYQPYREVEQVPAYPRINSQQQREDQSLHSDSSKHEKSEQSLRRFVMMRKLIDELTRLAGIMRVDYQTAQEDLHGLGVMILEGELIDQLLELKVPLDNIDDLLQQIREKVQMPAFEEGAFLTKEHNPFPVFVPNISEYNLYFDRLHLPKLDISTTLGENLDVVGRYINQKNRLKLDFIQFPNTEAIALKIMVQVAVSEFDDNGRRVVLYQRQDKSYALYADKQIDLSI